MRRTSQCAQFGNYARAIRRAQFVTAAARSQARLRDRAVVEAELHATLIRHTEQLTAAEDRANQIERSTEDWSVERRQLQRTCKALQAAQNATRNDVATARINERRRCLKQLAQWGGYRESAGPRRGGPTASTLLDEVERLSRQNEELLLDNQSLRQRLRDDEAATDAAAEDRALGDAFLGRAAEHLRLQGTSDELLAEAELLWGAERD